MSAQTLYAQNTAPRQEAKWKDLPELQKLSDEALVEILSNGCADALAVLFDRYHRLVLSIASKILRDSGEAEDLMQEVFFEIYRAASTFNQQKGTAKAWLLQYVYHRALNRKRYLNSRAYQKTEQLAEMDGELLPDSAKAWHGLTVQESSRLVGEVLDQLDDKQRQTLELTYFRGFLLREIADHLGESLPNVRHHYYRGLRKLRRFLDNSSRAETSKVLSSSEEGFDVPR